MKCKNSDKKSNPKQQRLVVRGWREGGAMEKVDKSVINLNYKVGKF